MTVKTRLTQKIDNGAVTNLQFEPDYADGRNAEWADATPSLTYVMAVKESAADFYEQGRAYTFTITETEQQEGESDNASDTQA